MPARADGPVADRLPELRDGELVLRPARAEDVDPLRDVLTEPSVMRWWGPYDAAEISRELRSQPVWTVWLQERVAGWIQVNEEELDGSAPHVALDIALAGVAQNRGLGRRALRLAIEHFIAVGHHRFTLDPALANTRAVRCYRGLGFRPVGILRRYERDPAGGWRDGLLMELLSGELREPD